MSDFPSHASGDRYGVFEVSEVGDSRWRAALERLAEGGPIAFEGIGFQLVGTRELVVSAPWASAGDPTMHQATRALDRAEAGLATLREQDGEFARLVEGREPRLQLVYDDGMAAVVVATRDDGVTRLV